MMDNDDHRTADRLADLQAPQVARFLADHPDWLANQSGLYELLSPPRRVHGEALADHMAAMITAARHHARTVLDASRAAQGLAERVRAAVLSLIVAADPVEWVTTDLPGLLGIDAARLCGETPDARCTAALLPPGTIARRLGLRDIGFRSEPDAADAALLHGEAAGLAVHEVLLRVVPDGMAPMLLALASRDRAKLDPAGHAFQAEYSFLAAAVAASLSLSRLGR